MSDSENFDFISQISSGQTYTLLIPEKKTGIIIFKIYELLKENSTSLLSESDLIRIIEEVKDNKRTQHEDIRELIQKLCEFFLKKYHNGYRLTDYARKFYTIVYKKVKRDLQPTEVEKKFLRLQESLLNIENLSDWYDEVFLARTKDIEAQLESFDIQVKKEVKSFKEAILSDHMAGIVQLREIDQSITLLSDQNQELKRIFRITHDIETTLRKVEVDTPEDLSLKTQVLGFFVQLTAEFERISNRTDKLSSKVRFFLEDIGRAEFEKNIRKLLLYSIERISVVGNKLLIPPELMKSHPSLKQKLLLGDNTRLKMEFFAKTKMYTPEEDTPGEEEINMIKARDQEDELISMLIERITNDLEVTNTVYCFPYFKELFINTQSISLIKELVFFIIKEFDQNKYYQIEILPLVMIDKQDIVVNDIKVSKLV